MYNKRNAKLRELLARPGVLAIPGCHDGISARMIQKVGYEVCYLGGNASMGSLLGRPDIGLGTATEMVGKAHLIADCIDLPLICDADTGYGDLNNVWRTVREYEAAGVSGIHIEDQVMPKKCGSMDGVKVIPLDEMCEKIKIACKARRDPNFVIIARTDCYKSTNLDEAIYRCQKLSEAGADLLMPTCIHDPVEMRKVTSSVKETPFLIDICEFSDREASFSDQDLWELGFKVVLRPLTSVLYMSHMLEGLYRHYKEHGSMESFYRAGELYSQNEYQDLLGFQFTNNIRDLISE